MNREPGRRRRTPARERDFTGRRPASPDRSRRRSACWPRGLALGVGHLAAGLFAGGFLALPRGRRRGDPPLARRRSPSSPRPRSARDDKPVLLVGMFVVITLVAAAGGLASRWRPEPGMVVIGAMGVLGRPAVISGPVFTQADLLAPLAAVVAGVGAFALLHGLGLRAQCRTGTDASRRTVLLAGGAAVGLGRAGVGGRRGAAHPQRPGPRAPTSPRCSAGRSTSSGPRPLPRARRSRSWARRRSSPPTATSTGSTRRCGCRRCRPTDWSLRVHGMVGRELTLRFEDLVEPPARRAHHHDDLRLQPDRRQPDLDGELRRRAAARRAARGGRRARRRPAVLDELGRLVHRHPDGHRAGARPRRAAGDRDERRGPSLRARVPGAHGRAGPLRLRVGHEVVGRPGGHHVRRPREAGLLAAARLVAARARSRR